MRRRCCSSPSHLCSFIPSLSIKLLMASMCSLNQPAPLMLWAQNVDNDPVNAGLIRNPAFLFCGVSSYWHWTPSSAATPESVPAGHKPAAAQEGERLTELPFWEGRVRLEAHVPTSWRSDRGHGSLSMRAHASTPSYPYKYVCVCHKLVHFMKHTLIKQSAILKAEQIPPITGVLWQQSGCEGT